MFLKIELQNSGANDIIGVPIGGNWLWRVKGLEFGSGRSGRTEPSRSRDDSAGAGSAAS